MPALTLDSCACNVIAAGVTQAEITALEKGAAFGAESTDHWAAITTKVDL